MKSHIIAIVLVVSVIGTASAAELLCSHVQNTVEEAKCMSAEIDKADKAVQEYLEAAKERISRVKIAGLQLDASQAEWSSYRTVHCGDVYRYWEQGTYRYRASAQCQIDLARARAHDIWSAYLTFADSTPALLPEPEVP